MASTAAVPGRNRSVALVALGCPKNLVDSEQVLGSFALAGYDVTTDTSAADVIVVTTCGFLEASVQESENTVRQVLNGKSRRPEQQVVVAGCLVERLGNEIAEHLPDSDLFVGLRDMDRIPELLHPSHFAKQRKSSANRIVPRLLSTPGHFAYLKIADGCDNRCTYCLIPSIRGSRRSRRIPEITREAESLAELGVKELVLVAQDTTAYGTDIYRNPALPRLLRSLARIEAIRWIRLMYTHPVHLGDTVIDQFSTNPKLCRYVDLPVQHVSDRILRLMNRRYCRSYLERLLDRLRAIPSLRLRTTVIVGFPGETEREFEELLEFLQTVRFDRLGAYAYSPEPGTPASTLRGQISEDLKQARLKEVMKLQAGISRRNLSRLKGKVLNVLADTPSTARTEWDAPEIDGAVRLDGFRRRPGEMFQVRITKTMTHDLVGCPVDSS